MLFGFGRGRGTALAGVFALLALFLGPPEIRAQVPRTLGYQGSLTDSAGAPVSGQVSMTFGLYDVESGGSALWQETRTVTVTGGVFDVVLGADSQNPLPDAAFENPLWLGVTVGNDGEMAPRQALAAAGYGIRAKTVEADTLSALECASGQFVRRSGADWVCDGVSDSDDQDSDGFAVPEDCDDGNAAVNPGAVEVCDTIDNNCALGVDEENALGCETWYFDADSDGYGVSLRRCLCNPADPYDAIWPLDCNDANASVKPQAPESCNGIDDNCNGAVDEFRLSLLCPLTANVVATDCLGVLGCRVAFCAAGWTDANGSYADGCETPL
jgi:hypothetical protein